MTTRILMVTGVIDKHVLYHRLTDRCFGQPLSIQTNAHKWAIYKHPETNTSSKFPQFNNLKCSTFSDTVKQLLSHDCMITDWRSPDEYKYLAARYNNIITARLFRTTMIEPDYKLNNWATEYLIVANTLDELELETAIKHYPFYKNYVLCDHL